jgi:hypothetical protein
MEITNHASQLPTECPKKKPQSNPENAAINIALPCPVEIPSISPPNACRTRCHAAEQEPQVEQKQGTK